MARVLHVLGVVALSAVLTLGSALAHAPSGAIFTTLADGSEVNLNLFPSKEAVYLDGGPGPGAPQHAAGLDDGTYVFQVTDPSGKTLLSTDPAQCRQFTVSGGIIVGTAPSSCPHQTGLDQDHGAVTVQLMPYDNTPNNGGVYKVWVTRVDDFLLGCSELGVANGLAVVDCGAKTGGNAHGFIPSHSKTDNFKVRDRGPITEIDVQFFSDTNNDGHIDAGEPQLYGMAATWTDSLGVSNVRYSYDSPTDPVNTYVLAHVEAVEPGTHRVTVANQVGCQVGLVHLNSIDQNVGPQTLTVVFPDRNSKDDLTHFIQVACAP
jgi:hypothetical protein